MWRDEVAADLIERNQQEQQLASLFNACKYYIIVNWERNTI